MSFQVLNDLELAELLVKSAAQQVLEFTSDAWHTQDKREGISTDIVTEADRAAQRVMIELLRTHRPEDGIKAEEDGMLTEGARQWLLDPIDGTLAYIMGIPLWAVAACLRNYGETIVTAIYHPDSKQLFTAHKGQAPLCNGEKIHVAAPVTLHDAVVHTHCGIGVSDVPEFIPAYQRLMPKVGCLYAGGSCSLKLSWIASGRSHAYIELYPPGVDKDWDWEPGSFLVRQAGGSTREVGIWRIAANTEALADELQELVAPRAQRAVPKSEVLALDEWLEENPE